MGVLIGMIVFRSDHGKSLAISDDWSSTGRSLSQHTLNTHTVVTVNNKVLYTRIVQPPVFT